MSGTSIGALKIAAIKIGLPVAEYLALRDSGTKWCVGCKAWHNRDAFAIDQSRGDGLTPSCKQFRNSNRREIRRKLRVPISRRGMRLVPARDGDRRQAVRWVNHLVAIGVLPKVSTVPCLDCGHIGPDRGHQYDHYLGYAAVHHGDVQAVCTRCHFKRDTIRRAAHFQSECAA